MLRVDRVALILCGDNLEDKGVVGSLGKEMDLDVCDFGAIEQSRYCFL
jgi:predicted dinucleotide-binding enzyme